MTVCSAAPATNAAEANDVIKTYGTGDSAVRALEGVDVAFPPGSFTAVMGPSGSGKSTLMHILAGLDTADSGRVLLAGTDLTRLTEHQRTLLRRDHTGFVFQSFNLIPALTAAENITLPLDLARRRADPAWLDQLVATLGLRDRLDHLPGQLSGGQQQRVAVARALVTRPAVVFADEPTGNLDSRAGTQLLELLRSTVDTVGQTVLMVTHDPVAASFADSVLYLADGRIVDESMSPTVDDVLRVLKRISSGEGLRP